MRGKWNQCPGALQRRPLPVANLIWNFLAQHNQLYSRHTPSQHPLHVGCKGTMPTHLNLVKCNSTTVATTELRTKNASRQPARRVNTDLRPRWPGGASLNKNSRRGGEWVQPMPGHSEGKSREKALRLLFQVFSPIITVLPPKGRKVRTSSL